MTKPLIATSAYLLPPQRVAKWVDSAVALPTPYLEALRRGGGQEAILMPTAVSAGEATDLLAHFDGLLLIGGPDVDPAVYGQEPLDSVYGVVRVRDDFELALVRAALVLSLPTLAICRGHQVLNVALGGDLDQHISDRYSGHGLPAVEHGAELHEVIVEPGSRLAGIMGVERSACSHHHHQVIDRLADGLRVVARAPDGLIEAVEVDGHPEVTSVQWHPEDTAADDPAHQRIFDAFVSRAGSSG
ncbi:MAG: gamma-glutamyl-gamma-aminobutyrate hydrolase family protein [Acidimicrobiia bacterium]